MDLNVQLGVIERVQGTRALVSYAVGLAIGTAVALSILATLFAFPLAMP